MSGLSVTRDTLSYKVNLKPNIYRILRQEVMRVSN